MTKSLLPLLVLLTLNSLYAATPQTCSNGATLNPGTLTVDCTVWIKSATPDTQTIHYSVSASDGGDATSLSVPVNLNHPEDFSDDSYHYVLAVSNSSASCDATSDQQLQIQLVEPRPLPA